MIKNTTPWCIWCRQWVAWDSFCVGGNSAAHTKEYYYNYPIEMEFEYPEPGDRVKTRAKKKAMPLHGHGLKRYLETLND